MEAIQAQYSSNNQQAHKQTNAQNRNTKFNVGKTLSMWEIKKIHEMVKAPLITENRGTKESYSLQVLSTFTQLFHNIKWSPTKPQKHQQDEKQQRRVQNCNQKNNVSSRIFYRAQITHHNVQIEEL